MADKKNSRQLDAYYRKLARIKQGAAKIETVSALDEYQSHLHLSFERASDMATENTHYKHAKKLFDGLYRHLPSGVFKHFTMLIIEHDKKFNNYGDQL